MNCSKVVMPGEVILYSIVSAAHAEDEETLVALRRIIRELHQHEQQLNAIQKRLAAGGESRLEVEEDAARSNPDGAPPSEGFRPLYLINRDGTDLKFLVAAPGMVTTGTPQWSHDGNSIVVDSTPLTDQVNIQSDLGVRRRRTISRNDSAVGNWQHAHVVP